MADGTVPGASWTQVAASALGGNPNGLSGQSNTPSSISQVVQALLASKAQQTPGGVAATPSMPSQQNSLGTYEGNVATPANPYNNGVYGMQPQSGTSSSYAAQPNSAQPPNPFGGTPPVPYNDPTMSALFMPPPSWATSQTN
jgi:hypothetical protein